MFIPIPYGVDYTTTVEGSVVKLVCCEQCQLEYVYQMTRKAEGSGSNLLFLDSEGAKDRAQSGAMAALSKKLYWSCDPVPCPACGWYQEHMVARARYLQYRWPLRLALVLLPLGALAFLLASVLTGIHEHRPTEDSKIQAILAWVLVGACALGLPGLLLVRRHLQRRYDPNQVDVEERKKYGQYRALPKEDYLKIIRNSEPDEDAEI